MENSPEFTEKEYKYNENLSILSGIWDRSARVANLRARAAFMLLSKLYRQTHGGTESQPTERGEIGPGHGYDGTARQRRKFLRDIPTSHPHRSHAVPLAERTQMELSAFIVLPES